MCSIVSLAFWTNYTYNASKAVEEAQQNLDEANENLAVAYADMPWTLTQIFKDIDEQVQGGQFTVEQGNWLKTRVS